MSLHPKSPILIVEDSLVDFEVIVESFEELGILNPIYHCKEGEEALDFIFQRGEYSNKAKAPRPTLILLDLNLPGTDGREVLAEIKKDNFLKSIPVVVLTTSTNERDIEKCYSYGANSYLQKPIDVEGFSRLMKAIKEFWCELAILPQ